jgi:hypothetical protein
MENRLIREITRGVGALEMSKQQTTNIHRVAGVDY